METEIQAEIRRVKKLSGYLRTCCSILIVVSAAVAALFAVLSLTGGKTNIGQIGSFKFPHEQMTLAMQFYTLLLVGVYTAIVLGGLVQLRKLFASLNSGEIYTSTNVQYLRRIGWLAVAYVAFPYAVLVLDMSLVAAGVFDRTMLAPGTIADFFEYGFSMRIRVNFSSKAIKGALEPLVMAGVVILASWIMEMGRRTAENADRLERDAELVV